MKVSILDCTLRDGGYVNDWEFGKKNIDSIISKLSSSNIEIIECGFLSNKDIWNKNQTKFNYISEIKEYITHPNKDAMYVAMINLGEYDVNKIPEYDGDIISGIRVVFHKHQVEEAIEYCKQIIAKGYKVFIQPMATINYTDKELLELVNKANLISPYAFYIVDSFGVMKQTDLTRMFYLLDHNLSKHVYIGYHAHNNLQLAYSNAQSLVNVATKRSIIIDSSVFGMGRGAGNLNTELFTEYLNNTIEKNYIITPLLQIIDDILNNIYLENYWGYSLAHYLSATFNCHPNYASYLSDKNVLTINEIGDILKCIVSDKRSEFDKEYIEEIYLHYQDNNIDDRVTRELFRQEIIGKEILIIAPGKTTKDYVKEINDYIALHNPIVICMNFIPENIKYDFLFISNLKRYHKLDKELLEKIKINQIIVTSNIKPLLASPFVVNYNHLLNEFKEIEDNAMLMLIKLFINCDIKGINIAGADGYSYENVGNYLSEDLVLPNRQKDIRKLNDSISLALEYFSKSIDIHFITPTKYTNKYI